MHMHLDELLLSKMQILRANLFFFSKKIKKHLESLRFFFAMVAKKYRLMIKFNY